MHAGGYIRVHVAPRAQLHLRNTGQGRGPGHERATRSDQSRLRDAASPLHRSECVSLHLRQVLPNFRRDTVYLFVL